MKIFLVSPVRDITGEEKKTLRHIVKIWERHGIKVHWPLRDTNQNDSVGLRICSDNRKAIKSADLIAVAWNGNSTGSLFDLGMAFAMDKPIMILVSLGGCTPTKVKSFDNMLLAWEKKSWGKGLKI